MFPTSEPYPESQRLLSYRPPKSNKISFLGNNFARVIVDTFFTVFFDLFHYGGETPPNLIYEGKTEKWYTNERFIRPIGVLF